MTKPPEKSGLPDLFDLVETWMVDNGYSREWMIGDSRQYARVLKSINPGYNGPKHLGSISGFGWIFSIWEFEIDSFYERVVAADDVWGSSTLKATDPEFFQKLQKGFDAVKKYRQGYHRNQPPILNGWEDQKCP